MRETMRPYTFANGFTLPKGELIAVPISSIHRDESIYQNATEFDGFRFSNLRELEGESSKYHCSKTGTEFLSFGHGHHAWYDSVRQL